LLAGHRTDTTNDITTTSLTNVCEPPSAMPPRHRRDTSLLGRTARSNQ
jgi:hypothetical protein